MIVFRTDASQKTGFGHLTRSSYLASLLKNKSEVLFCVNKDKTVIRFLDERHCSYCFPKDLERQSEPNYKSIIFDLRTFSDEDIRLLHQAKKYNRNTVQVTDMGLSQQDVDFTIDGSITRVFPYSEEKQNSLLTGPQYAILHSHFRHFNKIKRKYRQQIKKVFISFGGGATYRHLRNIIDLLTRFHFEVKIAPGFCLKKNSTKTLRRLYPGIRFVGETPSLARSLFDADVALISPGIAAYEAASVGTPALYFYYHEEQKATALAFEKEGTGLVISNIDDIKNMKLIDKMNELPFEKRLEMGNKGKQLVDARGVYRIIEFFETHSIL